MGAAAIVCFPKGTRNFWLKIDFHPGTHTNTVCQTGMQTGQYIIFVSVCV